VVRLRNCCEEDEHMNIAIYLPGWVGDAVMATPFLRAIRNHFPKAHIVGVVKPYVAGVLEGGNWFDELLQVAPRFLGSDVLSLAWQLRRRRIDLALLLPNSVRSALGAWLGSCRRRIGYARQGRSLFLTHPVQPQCDGRGRIYPHPIIDAYNRLAEQVGCPDPGRRMELFTTPADESAAERVWQQTGLDAFSEVICLNPGAAFGSAKHWPAEAFAALGRELAQRRGAGVLVLCGPSERDLCRQIATMACHPSVHALADQVAPVRASGPPLGLGLSKACVRRCSLLITTDSGPRHFAAAFDRPVVTLFGPTHIAWTETYHPRAVHLQKKVDCGPCQLRVCPLDHRCMKLLAPRDVFAAAERLLDTSDERAIA
jgi:heptosyltransferase II